MPDDSSRNVILATALGILAVLLSDLGIWTWLRQKALQCVQRLGIGLPTWLRKQLTIAPAMPFLQATASTDAAVDTPSADQIYLVTVE